MRSALPPRLYLRRHKDGAPVWVIRDRTRMVSTRFREEDLHLAQEVLEAYCKALQVKPGTAKMPQVMRTAGWVYFITCECQDFPIKIGWATNIEPRLKTLQCSLPYKAVLLAATRGSIEDETRFHIGFNQYRLQGEWFSRNPELMQLIERLSAKEVA